MRQTGSRAWPALWPARDLEQGGQKHPREAAEQGVEMDLFAGIVDALGGPSMGRGHKQAELGLLARPPATPVCPIGTVSQNPSHLCNLVLGASGILFRTLLWGPKHERE